jgi:hypothetical protein
VWYKQCCPQFSFNWGGGVASAQRAAQVNKPKPTQPFPLRSLSSHHTEQIRARARVTVRQPTGLMAPSGNWGRAPDPINKNRLGGGESGAEWEGALARTAAVAVRSTPNACCMLHGGRPPCGCAITLNLLPRAVGAGAGEAAAASAASRSRGVAGRPGSASQPTLRHGPHTKELHTTEWAPSRRFLAHSELRNDV